MGVKFHIASSRIWARKKIQLASKVAVKKGHFGRPKIQLSSKVAKFAGLFGIDLAFIFCMILKFEILVFFLLVLSEIWKKLLFF